MSARSSLGLALLVTVAGAVAAAPAVARNRLPAGFVVAALLECGLENRRPHQVRVHLAAIGEPIGGDPVYAGRGPRLLGRQALHAWKLAFRHPRTGQAMRFESPLPDDLRELLGRLRAP